MKDIIVKFTIALILVALLSINLGVQPARATGLITVNTNEDSVYDNGNCSLREAIEAAQTDTQVDQCTAGNGADTITFSINMTIGITAQLPPITSEVTINGSGANNIIITANINKRTAGYRIFQVEETGSLTLNGVTLRNGHCANACPDVSTPINKGGAIYNNGTLTITNVMFENNATFSDTVAGGDGGAIYNLGTLTVENSYFTGNEAEWGAGVYNLGSAEIVNNTFYNNVASENGGGIYNGGTLIAHNNTLFSNEAGDGKSGAGIYDHNGNLTLYNNLLAGNYQKTSLTENDCYKGGTGTLSGSHNLIETNDASFPCNTASTITNINPLVNFPLDASGPTITIALQTTSPAIEAGTNTSCPATDQRGIVRPQGARCDIGAYELEQENQTFTSNGKQDGWVLESSETSNKGGTLNKGASTLNVGDDAANKQYRAVLSFGTAALPDNAVITKVTLKVRRQGVTGGGNPINTFKGFMVDVKKGNFGKATLQLADFQTKGNKTLSGLKPKLVGGWYTMNLTTAKAQINLTGNTQIRLRFKLDDNNNSVANFLKLYSGNAGAANRPQLIVEYYTP